MIKLKIKGTFLILCLLLNLVPNLVLAQAWDGSSKSEPRLVEGVYLISAASELAWFAAEVNKGNKSIHAELSNDIDLAGKSWTPIGTSGYPYGGNFNGNHHAVIGVYINGSANYIGLFGSVAAVGVVRDLEVDGNIKSSGSGSSYYTGGVAAYNSGRIENCISRTAVEGKGYVGGVVGRHYGASAAIVSCANYGAITGSSTYGTGGIAGYSYDGLIQTSANFAPVSNSATSGSAVGGIVGDAGGNTVISGSCNQGDISGHVSGGRNVGGIAGNIASGTKIENVYNTGTVSGYNSIGGIVGNLSNGSIKNTYSIGVVDCKYPSSSYVYKGGIVGYGSISKCTDSYFLQSAAHNSGLWAVQGISNDSVCAKSETELKDNLFPTTLGSAFDCDPSDQNGGYPILKWQNPNALFSISLTVSPANAVVVLKDEQEEPLIGIQTDLEGAKKHTFSGLARGRYVYEVSDEEGDCIPQSASLTIVHEDIARNIALGAREYEIVFEVTPKEADFVLKQGNTVLTPQKIMEENTAKYAYSLANGVYDYRVECFGYVDLENSMTVNRSAIQREIFLERADCTTLYFTLRDRDNSTDLSDFRVKLESGNYRVSPEADGSFLLPKGTYSFTVQKSGYAKVSGVFSVDDAWLNKEQTIECETYASLAWDGETLEEPAYLDGYWQISTGAELAWFAAFINGTEQASVSTPTQNAVLLRDIELGSYPFKSIAAKIGYSSMVYNGIFDGNHKTISGLNINETTEQCGLFGKTSAAAVIRNVTVSGSLTSASTGSYAYAGGICGYNQGRIENCISDVAINETAGKEAVGGISGYNTGTIIKCKNLANVSGNGNYTGGICGRSYGGYSANAVIMQCINEGRVSFSGGAGQYKGGIVGCGNYTDVKECVNLGSVEAVGNLAGGIVGQMNGGVYLTDCYNMGTISSSAFAFGGLVGKTYGSNTNSGIANCYTIGEVLPGQSSQNYGAFVGIYDGGTVTNNYCLNDFQPLIGSGTVLSGITALLSSELKQITGALNANQVWGQNAAYNDGYPYLLWQYTLSKSVMVDGVKTEAETAELSVGTHAIKAELSEVSENGVLMIGEYQGDQLIRVVLGNVGELGRYEAAITCEFQEETRVKLFFWDKIALTPYENAVLFVCGP